MIEWNDLAIQALLKGDQSDAQTSTVNNVEVALENLRRGEMYLEEVSGKGRDVDRNLIIVILYNLACAYQRQ